MSAQEFLILAAGKGARFGFAPGTDPADKLRVQVAGSSLPQRAVAFAAANGARRVLVTVAAAGDGVLADVAAAAAASGVGIAHRRQDPDLYGPAAALLPWRGVIDAPLVVLFGDNLYVGTLPAFPDPDVLYFTCSEFTEDARNLRFAAVRGDRLVEKPHRFTAGTFFTGLLRLPAGFLDAASFVPGRRGELEITDAANSWPRRAALAIDPGSLLWDEVTTPEDVTRLEGKLAAIPS